MVIIRATVAKVMQNNLERMLAAWVMGREGERQEEGRAWMNAETPLVFHLSGMEGVHGCYFASALASFLTNALKIIEIENQF